MTEPHEETPLLHSLDDSTGVLTLTLNSPHASNAWSDALLDAMLSTIHSAQHDPHVRAIVLAGAGRSFCAGGDLRAMKHRSGMFAGDTVALRGQYTHGLQAVTRAFDRLEKPVICAIQGPAIGAGLDLSLMCDIRIASEHARFGSTFASVGLVPGDGGAFLLTRAVGFSRATELILSTRIIDADEALRIGLIHQLVPHDQLLSIAHERAAAIAQLPAPAVQMSKVALYRSYNHDLEIALQLTAALQGLVQHTAAHEAAVEAMLQKLKK